MVNSQQCFEKYGFPGKVKGHMIMWDVPSKYEINQIPAKIFCNKDLVAPLGAAFENLIQTNCITEVCTFDGCFNVRPIRGYEDEYNSAVTRGDLEEAVKFLSLHAWAIAVDFNAFENQLGTKGKFSPEFVKCFTDAGFDWGGHFRSRLDPMHFQLAQI